MSRAIKIRRSHFHSLVLNVEADKYAGVYRLHSGNHQPIIPLSPTRPVALDIQGRGFKSAIREAVHGPHLLEAMQVRYEWPNGVLETIDFVSPLMDGYCGGRIHGTRFSHFKVRYIAFGSIFDGPTGTEP
jgi:hypothetical protein